MSHQEITFTRFGDIALEDLCAHMSDPRVGEHLPLLDGAWSMEKTIALVEAKEAAWARDGLGHWAFLRGQTYLGWGGFQKEGDEWDFGLVLRPAFFGVGIRIAKQALAFAREHEDIPYVTFLLPPSRTRLGALHRLGASYVETIQHAGEAFQKFRLDTPRPK